jgi:hypothetical protein
VRVGRCALDDALFASRQAGIEELANEIKILAEISPKNVDESNL